MNQSEFHQLPVTSSKRGKNRAHKMQLILVLALLLIWLQNWRQIFKQITQHINRNRVITFDNHLKTALV